MVGGGIFAVLGLSVQLAGGGAPVAFALAGVVALLTARSYVRLSVRYPSQGGTVSFLDRAFGSGMVTGSANVLLWIAYIVMLALYAYAFGEYVAELIHPGSTLWAHALTTAVVVVITGLNLLSARLIGEAEDAIAGVNAAQVRPAHETGAVLCVVALLVLVGETWREAPARLGVLPGMIGLAVTVEGLYRHAVRRGDVTVSD